MFNNLVEGGPIPPNFRRDVVRAGYFFIGAVAIFLGIWGLVVVIQSNDDPNDVRFIGGKLNSNETPEFNETELESPGNETSL